MRAPAALTMGSGLSRDSTKLTIAVPQHPTLRPNPMFHPLRFLALGTALAALGSVAHAGITVQQNLGADATSWPAGALVSTTATPKAQATVGESFHATPSIAQSFTIPSGGNYTLQSIYLYAGGGSGSSSSAPIRVNLYDLGAVEAPNPNNYSTANNLLGSGDGVAITYTTQTTGWLKLDFNGTDQITLGASHLYVLELVGTSGTTPMLWYRTTSDTYGGGAAYQDGFWFYDASTRDFSMAVYGTTTTNQVAAATCTINAATTKQKIDGFGAGVAFLNNGVERLTDAQADQLYGTTGTQTGLTLLRVRIAPDGNNANSTLDAQKVHARGGRILATPWTPPADMKTNNALVHGSLLATKYGDYVAYLNNYIATMAAANAPVAVISLQNEPDYDPDYEGCLWTAEQFRTFCRDYAGKINAPVMMPESFGFDHAVSDATLNDLTAVGNIDYIGGHLYGATIRDYPLARERDLPVWMTEYLENDQTIASAITTGRQISDCLSLGNMSAYIWWKCIGDANGLLAANGTPQYRSHVMGQFSRFVRPGDYRVDIPTNTGPLGITAFKDTASGRFAIVAVNHTKVSVPQTFTIQGITTPAVTPYITSATQSLAALPSINLTNASFNYTVPAYSVVTFVKSEATGGTTTGGTTTGGTTTGGSSSSGGGGGGSLGGAFIAALILLALSRRTLGPVPR